MTARDNLRARIEAACEALAPTVARRVQAGASLPSMALVVVDGAHGLAVTLAGDGGRRLPDGSTAGVIALDDARALAAGLHPELARSLDGPLGPGEMACLAVGAQGSVVTVARWFDLAAPSSVQA